MTFIIAIDGHAASGKGTIAKGVADWFGFAYLDTGLIYRSVAQQALLKGKKGFLSKKSLINIARSFKPEYLELENLRSSEVGNYASKIASIAEVRSELVNFQRDFANNPPSFKGSVIDGRDIGSVVIPNAEIKFFIDASIDIRVKRRLKELNLTEESSSRDYKNIFSQIEDRDIRDKTRKRSPLIVPEGAYSIDTSNLTVNDTLIKALTIVNSILSNKTN